jgi:hypothetical protein
MYKSEDWIEEAEARNVLDKTFSIHIAPSLLAVLLLVGTTKARFALMYVNGSFRKPRTFFPRFKTKPHLLCAGYRAGLS